MIDAEFPPLTGFLEGTEPTPGLRGHAEPVVADDAFTRLPRDMVFNEGILVPNAFLHAGLLFEATVFFASVISEVSWKGHWSNTGRRVISRSG